jgi:hypothetical protein
MPAGSSRPTVSPRKSSSSSADRRSKVPYLPGKRSRSPTILPSDDPLRCVRDDLLSAYEKVNGHKPNMSAAHLWDAIALIRRAAPDGETRNTGIPDRAARRVGARQGRLSEQWSVDDECGEPQRLRRALRLHHQGRRREVPSGAIAHRWCRSIAFPSCSRRRASGRIR